jgi:citrate lyase subunit beta/citryl-CoA lyase
MPVPPRTLESIVEAAEQRRANLAEALQGRRPTDLPLRFWRQHVYFTTPASNGTTARKAVEGGYASALRLFERFGIDAAAVGEALGVPEERVAALWQRADTSAPVVMVDGEDAAAPRDDVVAAAREVAADVFRSAAWRPSTLRFYRPNGLDRPWTAPDLAHVLLGAGAGGVDAVVFPKAEHPEELVWLDRLLADLEDALAVPRNSVRVTFLVESGWALRNLDALALAVLPRLGGIIWGIADYSSDVGLPEVRNDHPTADWARMEIVNAAGAVGVPAIDTMSFSYPVASPNLTEAENRARILQRLKVVYDDARHGLALGMAGKWAGHPAQVFAVLLAYENAVDPADLDAKLAEVEAYSQAVAQARGAAIIGEGMMVDRATDRHARAVLRKAAAQGRLPLQRALDAGIITPEEARQLGAA